MSQATKHSVEAAIRQSPPIDLGLTTDDTWIKDKTIVITGGASGFGAGFIRKWAAAGATMVIGDINVQKGDQLVRDVKKETGNLNLYFFHCDVTDWQSQVQFFKKAVKASPHGGIDTVVANAGIADPKPTFERPKDLDKPNPPPPDLAVLNVNLTGVAYTTHLALYYLALNPSSLPANPHCDPARTTRDRHLLLLSSMAGLAPCPGQTLYGASKHALVGLYRNLRSTSFVHGVRVNLLCPYFMDTPMLNTPARAILAGGGFGKVEDVVDAGTRFVSDPRIVGRALVVGPRMKVKQDTDGEWRLVEGSERGGDERALWEIHADDFEDVEIFTRKYVGLLNRIVQIRGWAGWFMDTFAAVKYGLGWR